MCYVLLRDAVHHLASQNIYAKLVNYSIESDSKPEFRKRYGSEHAYVSFS